MNCHCPLNQKYDTRKEDWGVFMSTGFVYILCNDRLNVLYTGSTEDLQTRINHHKKRYVPGFTKKYNVHKLIYFEEFPMLSDALVREKQIKGYTRIKKLALIVAKNPSWRDLYDDIAKSLRAC
jgi:putative endonuclease